MPCVNRLAIRPLDPPAWIISSAITIASIGVPPLPPTASGKPTAEQVRRGGPPVQLPRERSGVLPRGEVRHHLRLA